MKMRKFLAILVVIAMLCSFAPVISAESTDDSVVTVIYEGEAKTSTGWGQAVGVMTTYWGGTIAIAAFQSEGYFTVEYTGTEGSVYIALQCSDDACAGGQWHQFGPSSTTVNDAGDGYVSVFSYATIMNAYCADTLADLGQIYVGGQGTDISVTKVTYVQAASEPEPEYICENVIYTGDTAYTGWMNWLVQIDTTNWDGTFDPAAITSDGGLFVYFTGTDIWGIHVALNCGDAGWTQFNKTVNEAKLLEDGSYLLMLPYDEIVAAYGTSDFSAVGAVQLASNSAETGSVTITKVTYACLAHDYTKQTAGSEVTPADCENAAVHYVACDKCGADSETTISVGTSLGHAWDNACDTECNNGCGTTRDITHVDEDPVDHICDVCQGDASEHIDENPKDHVCDNGCATAIGEHADTDGEDDHDHLCDHCGLAVDDEPCVDTDKDHKCDECGTEMGEHADTNNDHVCEYGCSVAIGEHADGDDNDHYCDYCNDENDPRTPCEDEDGDYKCNICGKDLCVEHTDEDPLDHKCDDCGTLVSEHIDEDKDHVCDNGCATAIGEHADTNKDHVCDYGCEDAIGICEDDDKDHACDYGCDKVYGEHADTDKDHACEYGCEVTIGEHADAEKDHACDYGCEEAIGEHAEGENKDHKCDYCSAKLSDCTDEDPENHECDICGEIQSECADEDADGFCDICGIELETEEEETTEPTEDEEETTEPNEDEEETTEPTEGEEETTEPTEDEEETTEPTEDEEETTEPTEDEEEETTESVAGEIYSSDVVISSGWQMAAQAYSTNWGGELDPAIFTEDGELVITLSWTGEFWNAHLVLQSTEKNSDGADWFQHSVEAADMTDNGDGSYTFTVSYDELTELYGFEDFSNLGCLYLYVNSNSGCEITVDSIAYIAAEVEDEEETTEPEATEPEATEPEATEPEATEPEATEPEATEPEATEPEATEPEATEPEATEPEATEPEATEPEATEPEATEPEATEPEAAEPEEEKKPSGSTTEIYSGNTEVPSGWQMAVQVYDVNWGGNFSAASTFAEGGHIEVKLTTTSANIWSAHVVLQGTGANNSWQQIDKEVAAFTQNADGSYSFVVTYDELVKAYGGSDFSDLGCFYVYTNSDADCAVTVNSVNYIVPGAEEDAPADEPTEAPVVTSKETAIFEGEAAATANWTIITEVMTTSFDGKLDTAIMTEGGYISIYYTGTEGQIYLALQDGTDWGWYQIDAPSTTKAVDGGYVSTFSYADLAKAYGKESFSDLGKVIVGSTNASDIVISQISWTQVSTNADTGDHSMIVLAVILMLLTAAAMVTTVTLKKRR